LGRRGHVALLFQQARQQLVALPGGDRRVVFKGPHQDVEVAGHQGQSPSGLLLLDIAEVALAVEIARPVARLQGGEGLRRAVSQVAKKVSDRLGEQPQSGEPGDVGDHLGGVDTLSPQGERVVLGEAAGDGIEHLLGALALHELDAVVVEGLLAEVSLAGLQAQGVVPLQVVLELLEHLGVGEIVPLLEEVHGREQPDRAVGPPHAVCGEGLPEDLTPR